MGEQVRADTGAAQDAVEARREADRSSMLDEASATLGAAALQRRILQRRQRNQGGTPLIQRNVAPPAGSVVDGDSKMVNSNRGDSTRFAHLTDGKVGSGFRKVYKAGGHEALVFLPEAGIQSPVSVFVFFHGHDADYGVDKTGNFEASGDNPAQATHMAESVSKGRPNTIAILASAEQHAVFQWSKVGVNLPAIVDDVFKGLKADLKMNELKPGTIQLAGHSAGGEALGLAVESAGSGGAGSFSGNDIHEVTVQEGGYGFPSFAKLAKWFLSSAAPKKIRVISVASHADFENAPAAVEKATQALEAAKKAFDADGSDENKKALAKATARWKAARSNRAATNTRNAVEWGGLSLSEIRDQIKSLKLKLTAAPGKGEDKPRPDGLHLESTIEVTGDGDRRIEIFHDTRHGHFGVRDHTTAELLSGSI